jgi:heavy metal sensor kinase
MLIAFSIAIYIFAARNLYEHLDGGLRSSLEILSVELKRQSAIGELESAALTKTLQDLGTANQAIAIFNPDGRLLAERMPDGRGHVRLPLSGITSVGSTKFYSLEEQAPESDDSCRGVVRRVRISSSGATYLVVLNQSLEPVTDQLESLQDIIYVAVSLALALAGLGGWFLARRSLAPVVAMSEQAQRISVENLDQRLPVANPRDELGRLAATFNELLSRLSNSFAQQRQFMADASHELRTPLSAIRTASTVILQREDREKSEYREALTIVEQQARRLTRIVEDMLVLAATDVGHPELQITQFYLDELLSETARAAAVLASQKDIHIDVPSLPEALCQGDEGMLRQMVWNLLDNAIKYTPKGRKVRITLGARDDHYVIMVIDTGSGIPSEAQAHIFERFYRADKSRARDGATDGSGAGLGLPIARWIAEAHHGQLVLQHSDEKGSVFVVSLPRA